MLVGKDGGGVYHSFGGGAGLGSLMGVGVCEVYPA
jgi:hypothetical protein